MKSKVSLSIGHFKAIHQAFKEIPNLSGVQIPAELSRVLLDEARSVTRRAWIATKESTTSKVIFTTGDSQGLADASPTVERDDETVIVRASAIAEQLPLWPNIADFIIHTLGEPEIYFRTGYSANEIRGAAACLTEELQGLRE